MNENEIMTAVMGRDWPNWQIWFVPRAVGPTSWHACRWDDPERRVLTAYSPAKLAELLEAEVAP